MTASLKEFKKFAKKLNEVSKYLTDAEIHIKTAFGENYTTLLYLEVRQPKFESVDKMCSFTKHTHIAVPGMVIPNQGRHNIDMFRTALADVGGKLPYTLDNISKANTSGVKTLKLFPEDTPLDYRPQIIQAAPLEVMEGDHTYRVVVSYASIAYGMSKSIVLMSREDEKIYDYLDKDFYIMCLPDEEDGKLSWVVSNGYDVNTAHIFMMCKIQPDLTQHLKDECFVSMYEAELLRLKLNKKLTAVNKVRYNTLSHTIDSDYKKNTTLIVLGKLIDGSVESTVVQNIKLSKTTASYEHVTIEHPRLLEVLREKLNFNAEFDIYTICSTLGLDIEESLNKLVPPEIPEIKINGISIVASINESGQRAVNGVRINKDEISKVIHRASCYRSASEYKLFLRSISKMSIKFHDIVANGLQLKIHDMTADEYRNPTPGPTAPALKFFIDKNDGYKLEVSKERSVRVQLGRLVKRVETINKRTDNGWSYGTATNSYRSGRRNAGWASEQLVNILIDCCTFDVVGNMEDGTKHTFSRREIKRSDIIELLSVVETEKKAAIERSKIFMDTAVKVTGAELIDFMGKKAYKVQGALRTYAIVIDNAKVYDFDSKQYRCIVNDQHYDGAGYDDVATRLLALKNDSVMQSSVSTLRGAAQPQYENAHNHTPEREVESALAPVIDAALARN